MSNEIEIVGSSAENGSSLGHFPGERWKFDSAVTDVFSDMLTRSIPQYEVMRKTVFDVARSFVQPQSYIVDIGCSRGDALQPFVSHFGEENKYLGLEISEPMLEVSKERFKNQIERGVVEIRSCDLRTQLPSVPSSIVLSVLTVQFVPIEHRQRLIYEIYNQLLPGGALILVEKVLGSTASVNGMMVDLYHKMKAENGYSQEEIDRKRLSLEGVLVPVTAKWNEELMRMAGFREVDCFWRWMNFAGWVAVKSA
jgi:tRNA (cmo5U34)-methyltransferase